MIDKEKTAPAMPNYEAELHKAMEKIKYLEMKVAQLNEANANYKAVIIALSAMKATAEAFLKSPIAFELNDIKEYFQQE